MSNDLLSTMDSVRTDSGNSVNSREVPDSPASGTGSGKSRYGRAHKPKISEDFLPTDKKVGAILGLSPKQSNGTVNSPNIKEVRKKARKLFDNLHEKDDADSKGMTKRKKGRPSLLPDAPQHHSTPVATDETEKTTTTTTSTPLSTTITPAEVSVPCDWVVGDLAWARVGRHPFWPCMVAIDPELNVFTKIKQPEGSTSFQVTTPDHHNISQQVSTISNKDETPCSKILNKSLQVSSASYEKSTPRVEDSTELTKRGGRKASHFNEHEYIDQVSILIGNNPEFDAKIALLLQGTEGESDGNESGANEEEGNVEIDNIGIFLKQSWIFRKLGNKVRGKARDIPRPTASRYGLSGAFLYGINKSIVTLWCWQKMKSGKATGPDDIPAEAWEVLGQQGAELIATLFNQFIIEEVRPSSWSTSITVLIWKGDIIMDPPSIANSLAAHFADDYGSRNFDPVFIAQRRKAEQNNLCFASRVSEDYNMPFTELLELELLRLLAPDLPSNGYSSKDLKCTHSDYGASDESRIFIYRHYLPVPGVEIGRGDGGLKRTLHVQFFGDKGRRSWVFANSVMRFKGRVSFNHEVERILSQIKKKYRKLTLAYSARESSRDKWEFAVKQAEGFMKRTREERIRFFAKHFPTKAATTKSDEASQCIKQKEKRTENSSTSSTRKRKRTKSLEDSDVKPQKLIKVEPGEPESPRQSVKKSASPVAKKRAGYKKFGRDFKAFVVEHFSRVADEHPEMNKEGVEEYLRETWSEMAPNERARYHTTAGSSTRDSSGLSSGDDNEDEEEGEERERSVIRNTTSTLKKGGSLFRGFVREKVCQICLKTGDTVKCKGPCLGVFHLSCNNNTVVKQEVLDTDEQSSINIKTEILTEQNGTPKGSSIRSELPRNVTREDSKDKLSCETVSPVKSLSNDTATTSFSSQDSVTGDQPGLLLGGSESSQDKCDLNSGFRCKTCIEGRLPPCFACNSEKEPKTQSGTRQRCVISQCGKFYHQECLKAWPQAIRGQGGPSRRQSAAMNKGAAGFDEVFTCPRHVCHTCASDDPRNASMRLQHQSLVWCIQCPTAYHIGNFCLPAGSEILTGSQIICPRHYIPPRRGIYHVNASWCSLCSKGGSLICCDLCPNSFHLDCLGPIPPPEDGYICEDCDTGRFPLYGEVVWVKLGAYRWWPALILFPNQIPENIMNLPHRRGEFAIRFFGSHDHYWVNRGRVFFYQEGSTTVRSPIRKQNQDETFHRALAEALEAHKKMKGEKARRETEVRQGMKPPPYVRIKSNKPVGNVRLTEANPASMTPCDCRPNSENPCGPDSDCINRILLVECSPAVCGAGDKCRNQCFEKRQYPPLMPYKTDGRGWGLKTLADIKKGDFVIEYVGELIDEAEYRRRLERKHQEKDENYYFLTIDKDRMLDAGPKGNIARFMNHSCQPNCETQKWTVNGDTRVGLFALSDIPEGTELTFNYNLECVGPDKKPCMCGAPNCSGFIGVKAIKQTAIDEDKKSRLDIQRAFKFKKKGKGKRLKMADGENVCFKCGKDGQLIMCDNKTCPKMYHLECVDLKRQPKSKWLCPWHCCNICHKRTIRRCNFCTDSFCFEHSDGNISFKNALGLVCKNHEKMEVPKGKGKAYKKLKVSAQSPSPNPCESPLVKKESKIKKEKPSEPATEKCEPKPEESDVRNIESSNVDNIVPELPSPLPLPNGVVNPADIFLVKRKRGRPRKSSVEQIAREVVGLSPKKLVSRPNGKIKTPFQIEIDTLASSFAEKNRSKNRTPNKVLKISFNGHESNRMSHRKRQPPKKMKDYFEPNLERSVKEEPLIVERKEESEVVVQGYKQDERSPRMRKTILQRVDHKVKSDAGYINIEEAMGGILALNSKMPVTVGMMSSPVNKIGQVSDLSLSTINHTSTGTEVLDESSRSPIDDTPQQHSTLKKFDSSSAFLLSVGS
ncbi:histone-lysine N-methyltransferase NSD2 [Anabrus simplex]|uniref:histone-lysine N-methyltransferase NSD2 n=1 Tax=Anabrus simplex TaxID=316456 RepID=UPI0035A38A7D